MKFYISSAYENMETVRKMADILRAHGHRFTYDWTSQEAKTFKGMNVMEISKIARMDAKGVKDSELFILILPGGRGTHTELGLALSEDREIIICAGEYGDLLINGEVCPFYCMNYPSIVLGGFNEWTKEILNYLKCMENSK